MDGPSYVTLSGQLALQRELEVTANNVANINSPGFKQDRVLFQSYLNRMQTPGQGVSFVQDRATYIDQAQGALEQTGNPLDLAIDGDAFFAVEGTNGAPAYTRDGRLRISPDGTLVNASNRPVLTEGNGRIQIPPNTSSIDIRLDGTVTVTAEGNVIEAGRLGLHRASEPRAMRKTSDGLFEASPAAGMQPLAIDDRGARVVQRAIERSTVNAVREVANLTELQRAYERGQRIVTDDDQRVRKMLETLGRPAN